MRFSLLLPLFAAISAEGKEGALKFAELQSMSTEHARSTGNPGYAGHRGFMRSLPAETIIEFSDGAWVELGQSLVGPSGSGKISAVYEIRNASDQAWTNKVLKFPLSHYVASDFEKFTDGVGALRAAGVDTIGVLVANGASDYAVVERLPDNAITGESFQRENNFETELKRKAAFALLDFALSTAALDKIDDFRMEQMAYLPALNKWVLVDWGVEHKPFTNAAALFESEPLGAIIEELGFMFRGRGIEPYLENGAFVEFRDAQMKEAIVRTLQNMLLVRQSIEEARFSDGSAVHNVLEKCL